MKVDLTITDAEVREAIREWMERHGIPNVITGELRLSGCRQTGGWDDLKEARVKVTYEAEALTEHGSRVLLPVEAEEPE